MILSYYAARANLYHLWQLHPEWEHAALAAAIGSSKGWVKKWLKRLREEQAAGVPLADILSGHSRAREHPPVKTAALVVEQVLAIRDQPPEGLRRVPGQQAIRYYLERDGALLFFQLPIPSAKTIDRILKAHDRIPELKQRLHQPMERPAPMTCWQIDFKDVSSVPADPHGKRQHVVETLNIIDMGTSVLLDAQVRADFTAETALQAVALTLAYYPPRRERKAAFSSAEGASLPVQRSVGPTCSKPGSATGAKGAESTAARLALGAGRRQAGPAAPHVLMPARSWPGCTVTANPAADSGE